MNTEVTHCGRNDQDVSEEELFVIPACKLNNTESAESVNMDQDNENNYDNCFS